MDAVKFIVYFLLNSVVSSIYLKSISSYRNIRGKDADNLRINHENLPLWFGKGKEKIKIGNRGQTRNNIGTSYFIEIDNNFGKLKDSYKKILVKRLIPHGLPPSRFDYDAKYKTYYNPIIRVHKRKALPKIGTILNINKNIDDIEMNKYGNDVRDYYDNEENVINFVIKKQSDGNSRIDSELLQPFVFNIPNEHNAVYDSTQLKMIQEIKELLKYIHSRSTRLKNYDSILKVIDSMINLRTLNESGDEMDPLVMDLIPHHHKQTTPKPKKHVPHYPPWNYWTYKKTIHQDLCPKGQVSINNHCIWIPPH